MVSKNEIGKICLFNKISRLNCREERAKNELKIKFLRHTGQRRRSPRFFGGKVLMLDLRSWLEKVEEFGQLKKIEGADWNLEIGCATYLNMLNNGEKRPALLFDKIKDYPKGYRVLTCSMANPDLLAHTFNLPTGLSNLELLMALRSKLQGWVANVERFPPEKVDTGPVLQNIQSGNDVNLLALPVPKWHELDGGRYIGTGHAVITRDPDTGQVNLGTYRTCVLDNKSIVIFSITGQHGRVHREKYHARGKPCPIALSIGHHPLIFALSGFPLPYPEYEFAGAVTGKPVRVIKEEITGLPIPADSEIVIAGWSQPGDTVVEGPFGEWTGYYADKRLPMPVVHIDRIYHRNDPILLGSLVSWPGESTFFTTILRSVLLQNEMERTGIQDINGVWLHRHASRLFIVISVKQRYPGHAMHAAVFAAQSRIPEWGRYIVTVDEDIDPTNLEEVLFAMCTRVNIETDIHIIKGLKSSTLDPVIRRGTGETYTNSVMIIDACKPYAWKDEFPKRIEFNSEILERVKKTWFSEP